MTTNVQRVTGWHDDRPKFTERWTARDWDVADLVARKLDEESDPEPESCLLAPPGWYCTRQKGHEGPCATVQDDRLD